jgi:hypothetical protein
MSKQSKAQPKAHWVEPGTYRDIPPAVFSVPNLVTIHDLSPEEREQVEIHNDYFAKKWRWKRGHSK